MPILPAPADGPPFERARLSRTERFVDSLPVRLGTERLAEIELAGVFAEG